MRRGNRATRWWIGVWLAVCFAPVMGASLDTLAVAYAANEDGTPVIIERSSHDFDRTLAQLKRAIAGQNFRIIREQKLSYGLELPGQAAGRETILYFCNFAMVNQAIHIDHRVGQFLPCRITVVEQRGEVYLMSINPKRMATLFANDQLSNVCEQITEVYKELMSEATL